MSTFIDAPSALRQQELVKLHSYRWRNASRLSVCRAEDGGVQLDAPRLTLSYDITGKCVVAPPLVVEKARILNAERIVQQSIRCVENFCNEDVPCAPTLSCRRGERW